jgi:hypothetical protein
MLKHRQVKPNWVSIILSSGFMLAAVLMLGGCHGESLKDLTADTDIAPKPRVQSYVKRQAVKRPAAVTAVEPAKPAEPAPVAEPAKPVVVTPPTVTATEVPAPAVVAPVVVTPAAPATPAPVAEEAKPEPGIIDQAVDALVNMGKSAADTDAK